jgi:hypothetical protein
MDKDEAPASPKDAALKLALEYIETNAHERRHVRWAIKEALIPATPQQRPWVGLTDDDLLQIRETVQVVEGRSVLQSLTKAIEQALKEKNT